MGRLEACLETTSICASPSAPVRPSSAAAMTPQRPLTAQHFASIADIPCDAWDGLFPDRAEDWDYFCACEAAAPEGITASAIAVFDGDKLVAAAPLFRTDYRLDMSLEGSLKPIGDWLYRNLPKLVVMPVLGLGSPLTEECPIGFDPALSQDARTQAFNALIKGVERYAAAEKISLLALKDVTDRAAEWMSEPLDRSGFCRVGTLPLATLHLPFKDEAEYLASLSSSMRSDIRKKMRRATKVEIEYRDTIDGIEEEISSLFQETRANRKADYGDFDDVPETYFREVMNNTDGNAMVMLARVDGQLVSFNIALIEKDRVLAKYIGMRYPAAREHNLYFVNWMAMVRFCRERGITWMQPGQTSYKQKVRLGCKLKRSFVYFKHRNPLINPFFRLFGPMMAFDKMEPDLEELGESAPYLDTGTAP